MRLLLTAVVLLALTPLGFAKQAWMESFLAAKAQAKQEKKTLLLDFTGSDWCPWCIKLSLEVFQTPQFKDYAAKQLVLMKVDFPMGRELPGAVQTQNAALAEKYHVKTYPTIVLLDPNGKLTGSLGYLPGGPQPFLKEVERLRHR